MNKPIQTEGKTSPESIGKQNAIDSAMVILRDLYDDTLSGKSVGEIRTEINKALRILRRAKLGLGSLEEDN